MIYEYPEEFVVPVVYTDDLNNKPMHRDFELEYLKVDEVLVPDMDILKEPYQKNMISYSVEKGTLENDHVKEILKEIDDEYAKSETLRM